MTFLALHFTQYPSFAAIVATFLVARPSALVVTYGTGFPVIPLQTSISIRLGKHTKAKMLDIFENLYHEVGVLGQYFGIDILCHVICLSIQSRLSAVHARQMHCLDPLMKRR